MFCNEFITINNNKEMVQLIRYELNLRVIKTEKHSLDDQLTGNKNIDFSYNLVI